MIPASKKKNTKSILFLFEGYTEEEFYNIIFELKKIGRAIRISKKNLKGQFNINNRVTMKIKEHLNTKTDEAHIDVIIACDREGGPGKLPTLNIDFLNQQFKDEKRIKRISSIVATQDLESWLFHDYQGICNFLKIPQNKRNEEKYKNVEKLNNRDLATLFKNNGKIYFKRGNAVRGFISSLDIQKIIDKSPELSSGIDLILKLVK